LQGTKLPMRVWFRAMHLLAQGKKILSNIELGRRLGISTNAAWQIQHKLMQAMIERDRRYMLGAAGPRIFETALFRLCDAPLFVGETDSFREGPAVRIPLAPSVGLSVLR
jgi:hypothetical protein